MKTYKITQAQGNSRGEKMVRELLDRETESAKKGHGSEISRTNYDFVFLRQETFGIVPEYVLGIVPKRKDKYPLRGQIWVDANTFHIRRIEGIPAKSRSFWIKGIHITLQFAQLGGMWVPVSFDAIATVRFLGQYTLAGSIRKSPNRHLQRRNMSRESVIRKLFLEDKWPHELGWRVTWRTPKTQTICLDGTYRTPAIRCAHRNGETGSAKLMSELCSLDQPNRFFQAYAVSTEEMNNCSKGAALVFCKEAMKYDHNSSFAPGPSTGSIGPFLFGSHEAVRSRTWNEIHIKGARE